MDTGTLQVSTENVTMTNVTSLYENVTSSANATGLGRDEDLARIEVAVSGLIFALAVLGNGLVLVILLTRRKKLSRMNMMIVHLSAADLFVAFFNVLPQLIWDITHRFYGNDFLCRFVKYTQVVAMYASSYVLVSTAIDRYLAIVHPLTAHTWTSRRLHALVGVAWLCSALFSLPQIAVFRYMEVRPGSGVYDCWATFSPDWTLQFYITFFTVAVYVIPLVLLVAAYGRICYVVFKSMMGREAPPKAVHKDKKYSKNVNGVENGSLIPDSHSPTSAERSGGFCSGQGRQMTLSNPRAHVKGVSRAKVKTVKLTITVIVCYLICWGPFFVAQMWSAWDPNAPFEAGTMVIILLLASLNSCTNPWIYMAFSTYTCREFCTKHCREALEDVRANKTSSSHSQTMDLGNDSKMKSNKTEYTSVSNHEMPLLKTPRT